MKVLVLGASENTERYSNKAIKMLKSYGHEVQAVGNKPGNVDGILIKNDFPTDNNIDTLTLYLNPANQKPYYDKIIKLHPPRVIFNPGTENEELSLLLNQNKIETEEACTLVLLSTGQF